MLLFPLVINSKNVMCCRTPAYGVRANSLKQVTVPDLARRVNELGGGAEPSCLLPNEFCRVTVGLQQIFSSGMGDRGLCMVTHLCKSKLVNDCVSEF